MAIPVIDVAAHCWQINLQVLLLVSRGNVTLVTKDLDIDQLREK